MIKKKLSLIVFLCLSFLYGHHPIKDKWHTNFIKNDKKYYLWEVGTIHSYGTEEK